MKSSKGKVCVTGVAGFIGSHLADKLIEEGYEVIGIDNLSSGKLENINSKIEFFNFDVGEIDQSMFRGVDYVFHLAAQPRPQVSIKDPVLSHDSNVTGTFNVLLESQRAGVKKVIYASSSHAPYQSTPYALQKWMGEEYCKFFTKFYGLETVILRYFNVYGERQIEEGEYATVIGKFLKQYREGKPLTIYGDGFIKRQFTYVKDVIEKTIEAVDKPHDIYDIVEIPHLYIPIKNIALLISENIRYLEERKGEDKIILSKAENTLGIDKFRLKDWIKTQL